ncbi:hypothetical protein [Aurantiacibacter suaedae]|uniref:hypothetical protein n=1 Tax=Aurantiacibacter suaedae TaxID=2545755 RepID=UPI0010F98A60|nr:hypothetical protein [Aurantiacibacter suaedae]
MSGAVFIYRWRVAAEHETAFLDRWREATRDLGNRGGLGSLIGKNKDGELVAIALWPDAETRDAAFASNGDAEPWPPNDRLAAEQIDPLSDMWKPAVWRELNR